MRKETGARLSVPHTPMTNKKIVIHARLTLEVSSDIQVKVLKAMVENTFEKQMHKLKSIKRVEVNAEELHEGDHSPVIALDFDGVLHAYRGVYDELHSPVPGSLDAVRTLIAAGFTVVVYTYRDAEMVRVWLTDWGFPPLEVTHAKGHWKALVDDRCFRFGGGWTDMFLAMVMHSQPWWKQEAIESEMEKKGETNVSRV